jgi:cbb3-type cytochrome oxidase cytochrome c subunit
MIATPQLQLGDPQPTNVPPANLIYPTPYSGLASAGREVYRANGCAYCHTQVVRQQGFRFDVVVSKPGTNQTAVLAALGKLRSGLPPAEIEALLASPGPVLTVNAKAEADAAQATLSEAGAEAAVRLKPTGADIERGWGTRLSVARDYLYDAPLLLGTVRLGPDLTNVGLRRPDEVWHLIHLYDPKLEVPGSIMPRYPFLFEKRQRGSKPNPNALAVPGALEILPTPAARALAAYLASLRVEMPLFEAPAPLPPHSSSGAADTNLPAAAAAATNPASPAESPNSPATNSVAPK